MFNFTGGGSGLTVRPWQAAVTTAWVALVVTAPLVLLGVDGTADTVFLLVPGSGLLLGTLLGCCWARQAILFALLGGLLPLASEVLALMWTIGPDGLGGRTMMVSCLAVFELMPLTLVLTEVPLVFGLCVGELLSRSRRTNRGGRVMEWTQDGELAAARGGLSGARLPDGWQVAWATGRAVDRRTVRVHPRAAAGTGPRLAELDGRLLLLSEERYGPVRIGDALTGEPGAALDAGREARVAAVVRVGGRVLLLTGHEGPTPNFRPGEGGDRLQAWDLRTGEPVGAPLTVAQGLLTTVAGLVLPDGRTVLVTGGWDGLVRVWDLATGRELAEPAGGHQGWVAAVAVAEVAGCPVVVSAGEKDEQVLVRDLTTGRPALAPLTGHTGAVLAVLALPGGGRVATAGMDGTVRLWDLAEGGRQAGAPLAAAPSRITALATARIGGRHLLAAGGWERVVQLWDLATGDPVADPFSGHEQPVEELALLDGAVAARAFDGTVRVWTSTGPRHDGRAAQGFEGSPSALLLVAQGERTLAVRAGYDGTVRHWDAAGPPTGEARLLAGPGRSVHAMALAMREDRRVLLTGGESGGVRVLDLAGGEPITLEDGERGPGRVTALAAVEQDGRVLVLAGGPDGTVRIWDLASGRALRPLAAGEGRVLVLAAAPVDGRTVLVTGHSDHTARCWDLARRRPLGPPLHGHRRWVDRVATAVAGGRPVAVTGSGYDSRLRVWDLATGREQGHGLHGHLGRLADLVTTVLDGRPVAVSAGDDATVRVWDLATLEPLGEPVPLPYRPQLLAALPQGDGVLVAFGAELALLRRPSR
ncbi:WD40 repeat domain-containing protein [Kitasatospora sp. NPDC006697]|uniref:WD40 repeat domain-containing protein n=1 Tax=Kitasatospora sp. NPDC006697 TaxID=3364020 RepID=UPI00367603E1